MASVIDKDVKWPAVKVRETFLDYFQKNGHTFGMYIRFTTALIMYTEHP